MKPTKLRLAELKGQQHWGCLGPSWAQELLGCVWTLQRDEAAHLQSVSRGTTEKPNWSSAVCDFQLFAYRVCVRFDFDITSGPLTYCGGRPAFMTAVRTHFHLMK